MKKTGKQYIEFKIKHAPEEVIKGLLICYSKEWTLLSNNVVDYVMDGYLLVRNNQIADHLIHPNDQFTSVILNKKSKGILHPEINLDSSEELFMELFRKKIVFSMDNYKKNTFVIGRIKTITDKELQFELLSTKAKWLKAKRIKFSDIHVIGLDTDYINSLLLVAPR